MHIHERVSWVHLWGFGKFPAGLITERSGHIQPLQPQQLASFRSLLLTGHDILHISYKKQPQTDHT